ncbi:MAG: hypothetical protein OXH92_21875 [Bryobacterales bacterium]|nr:hypothetical protein [Bryobacterales bacterium]MDE0436654.1 hypothetical protein [Bryobacterales bacterium]
MTGFTALLDTNILYPAPMRDIFLQMAADDFFRAKWTEDIHREWIDALIRNEPHRDRATLEHRTVLASMGPVRLVDRLSSDQPPLRFAINGITLVYGANASGKSGYCRT